MEDKEMDNMMEFVHAIMYPHKEEFLATVRKHIDFSDNEKLWKELSSMSGLGMSVLQEGCTKGKQDGAVSSSREPPCLFREFWHAVSGFFGHRRSDGTGRAWMSGK